MILVGFPAGRWGQNFQQSWAPPWLLVLETAGCFRSLYTSLRRVGDTCVELLGFGIYWVSKPLVVLWSLARDFFCWENWKTGTARHNDSTFHMFVPNCCKSCPHACRQTTMIRHKRNLWLGTQKPMMWCWGLTSMVPSWSHLLWLLNLPRPSPNLPWERTH